MGAFSERYGPWALVTGASAGIGQAFARQLAARGLNLVLVARRQERLEALAAELGAAHGTETRVVALDLTRDDFLPHLQVATAGIDIGLLVNNAGFSFTGDFFDNPLDADLRMLHLNVRAPLILTHAFGPALRARGRGGMIFVSSIAAYVAVPIWTHYSATKAYVLHLAEGVAGELAPDGVDVLALCPGTTRTEFLDVAELNEFLALDADVVVAEALRYLGRKRRWVPHFLFRAGGFMTRFLPVRLSSFVASQVVKSMRRR